MFPPFLTRTHARNLLEQYHPCFFYFRESSSHQIGPLVFLLAARVLRTTSPLYAHQENQIELATRIWQNCGNKRLLPYGNKLSLLAGIYPLFGRSRPREECDRYLYGYFWPRMISVTSVWATSASFFGFRPFLDSSYVPIHVIDYRDICVYSG